MYSPLRALSIRQTILPAGRSREIVFPRKSVTVILEDATNSDAMHTWGMIPGETRTIPSRNARRKENRFIAVLPGEGTVSGKERI